MLVRLIKNLYVQLLNLCLLSDLLLDLLLVHRKLLVNSIFHHQFLVHRAHAVQLRLQLLLLVLLVLPVILREVLQLVLELAELAQLVEALRHGAAAVARSEFEFIHDFLAVLLRILGLGSHFEGLSLRRLCVLDHEGVVEELAAKEESAVSAVQVLLGRLLLGHQIRLGCSLWAEVVAGNRLIVVATRRVDWILVEPGRLHGRSELPGRASGAEIDHGV